MQVNSAFVADLRELHSTGDLSEVKKLTPSSMSIGAAIELTCLRSAFPGPLALIMDDWAQSCQMLNDAFLTFQNGRFPSSENMWAVREVEFFPIRDRNWAEDSHYHPFESRFCKAAKDAGFGDKADGITGALFEMADNVIQHSTGNCSGPGPGLIGYYVTSGHVAFAIGDVGRGVLASLKENPAWENLQDSKEALLAVIMKHASRRPYGGEGEGFKEVLRSLANLNGIVEMASEDGRIRLFQTPTGRKAVSQFTGTCPGFQLSVNCSLSGPPQEKHFPLDNLT